MTENNSFSWPGGAGPHSGVPFYDDDACGGGSIGTATVVVAANAADAQAAIGSSVPPDELPSDPAPTGGCSFFGLG